MSKLHIRCVVGILACLLILGTFLCGCAKPKTKSDVVVLKLTMWGKQEDLDFYKTALKEFYKEHPNIRVNIEITPWARVFDKLLVSTAGGSPPDVSRISSIWFAPCASKNLLECLDPYIENDPEFDINDFYKPAVEGWGTYKGKMYTLPSDVDVYALYYNKTMFDKCGIPYPDETWDWDKFVWAAKKLTKDNNGDGRLDQWGAYPATGFWHMYVWQNGGDIVNKEHTKCTLDQPEAYEALQFMADMPNKYRIAPSAADAADIGAQKLFTNGQIGMFVSGSWAAAIVFNKEINTFDYDVAPLPKGKQRASFIGGGAFGILSRSKHKKEAWELVKFMTSPVMQKHYAETQQVIPSRRSVAESGAYLYLPGKPVHKQVFIDTIEYGRPLPQLACSREMTELMGSEIILATIGKKPAKEACEKVTRRVDKLLKYNRE